jgi:hypothetical protein
MRDNGVDMPDPGPGQDGFFDAFHTLLGRYDQATLQEAVDTCSNFFPTYAGGAAHGQNDEALLALADCLREQGLDVSDNLFEDEALGDIDPDQLRAALDECREVLSGIAP